MPPDRRRRLLVDLTPLRVSRDYRLLFVGSGISYLGRQLTVVAIPFQIFTMTRSSLAVGMVGLVTVVPLVTLSLAGGAIADAVESLLADPGRACAMGAAAREKAAGYSWKRAREELRRAVDPVMA